MQLLMKLLTIFANVLLGNAVLTTDVAIGRTLQACGHAQLQSLSKLSSGSRRAELMVFCTAMQSAGKVKQLPARYDSWPNLKQSHYNGLTL